MAWTWVGRRHKRVDRRVPVQHNLRAPTALLANDLFSVVRQHRYREAPYSKAPYPAPFPLPQAQGLPQRPTPYQIHPRRHVPRSQQPPFLPSSDRCGSHRVGARGYCTPCCDGDLFIAALPHHGHRTAPQPRAPPHTSPRRASSTNEQAHDFATQHTVPHRTALHCTTLCTHDPCRALEGSKKPEETPGPCGPVPRL